MGKFTVGKRAVFKLTALARLMLSMVSAHNGSDPGTGEKTKGSTFPTVQEGDKTNQLAFKPWTFWIARGIQACQVGSAIGRNSTPAQNPAGRAVTGRPTCGAGVEAWNQLQLLTES